jgi:hypothetical protein
MSGNRDENEELREVKAVLQSLSKISADRLPASSPGQSRPNVITGETLNRNKSLAARPEEKPAGGHWKLGTILLAALAGGTVLLLAGDLFLRFSSPGEQPAGAGQPAATAIAPPASIGTMRAAYPQPQAPGGAPPQPAAKPFSTATVSLPGSSAPSAAAAQPAQPGRPASAGQDAAPAAVPAPAPLRSPAIANAKEMMDAGKVSAARALLQPLASTQDAAWLIARSYDPNYLATVKSPDVPGDKEKALEWYRRWRDIGAQNGVMIDDGRLKRFIETLN